MNLTSAEYLVREKKENEMEKVILDTLVKIQTELKAPKSQFNSFGKYNYRNCEDILEALKPILNATKSAVVISDEIVLIGQRYYVKATVVLTNGAETVTAAAYAREEEDRKGMDRSQITGATSSYARKYALNGLFAIDDTKDADSGHKEENGHTAKPEAPKTTIKESINIEQALGAAKDTTIQAIMGLLQTVKERQTSTKKDITDYYMTSMDGNHKIKISKWGKTHEGLHAGQVVIMKEVKVGWYQNAPTFLANEVEAIGHDTIQDDPGTEDTRDFTG